MYRWLAEVSSISRQTTVYTIVLCAVYVDDFICSASTPSANTLFLEEVEKVWKISNLGEASFCVGLQIH
jgi:hypothetical protein